MFLKKRTDYRGMSPHLDHVKYLTLYCHSKGDKQEIICAKWEGAIGPSRPSDPTVTESCMNLKLKFGVLGTSRGRGGVCVVL
jgi:hypothetical protein